ncbi:hypothetical protein AXG93_1712s1260 [Marchantia polymorpha subsp. ruderalis]|nr:hypothetical protein AXG93_1712s1260 [Marchantia polymorpha subsp. ruderalis]
MLTAAAAESSKKVSRVWQKGSAYIPIGSSSSRSCRADSITDDLCSPSICHVLMLLISVAMFTSTLVLLQSLRTNQAVCFVPRFSKWRSSPSNPDLTLQDKLGEADELNAPNDKEWLLKQSEENGTASCHNARTTQAMLFGIDQPAWRGGNVRLQTNQNHQILLVSYTEDGSRRCSGGDFYETDLSGPSWKSRPTVKDLGDGSYLVDLKVDSRQTGLYSLKVVLLFDNLHGLDVNPEPWILAKEVVQLKLEFIDELKSSLWSDLQLCNKDDFRHGSWRGRWTRAKANESCTADDEGRFKCLNPGEECEPPWCEGPVGSLESNGWVYSAHCAFRIFTQQEAWTCLSDRWLFFWGDSNHQDTIRNLLNFVLGRQDSNLGRTFESTFSNPRNSSQFLKITSYFNGHFTESDNNLGLASLADSDYRHRLSSYFLPTNPSVPDAVILNSGLHDGKPWTNLTHYVHGARRASSFWGNLWRASRAGSSARPKMLFRTTVAPAGEFRNKPANPQKMEVYNTILGELLVSEFGPSNLQVVDAYDMTFPWHFDNQCSDGGHYGRPPALNSWLGIRTGHHYFVDVMLAHVLLNALCPLQQIA